jgi:hypothetical protein
VYCRRIEQNGDILNAFTSTLLPEPVIEQAAANCGADGDAGPR